MIPTRQFSPSRATEGGAERSRKNRGRVKGQGWGLGATTVQGRGRGSENGTHVWLWSESGRVDFYNPVQLAEVR